MDFSLTSEQQMLTDTLARYLKQDYPLAARLAAGVSDRGFSAGKWAELADLGVIGALFEEGVGGYGGTGFDLSVVFEAIGKGLVVEPFLASLLAGSVLAHARSNRFAAVMAGTSLGAFAHFEAGDGWDMAYIETRAGQVGDGWQLSGEKAVVRHGAAADFLIVSARTSGKIGERTGLSLFLVPTSAKGLTLRDYTTIDGGRAAEISLDGVAAEALIGAEGQGEAILTDVLGRAILCLCAEAVGIMDVIKDMTIDYLQTRKQFGVPIGKFQALQHRMAELLLEIEQARAAVINAAAHLDVAGLARERALSAAKFTIGQVGTLVAEESIQMHGGIGMTWEYPLGHYAKRLVMIGQEMGDEDHHLARYIALGKGA